MKITIESISNGYLISYIESEDNIEKTYAENPRDLLLELQTLLGASGSRHDEKRIYIIEAPGDKNEKFTEAHHKVIWGDDDDGEV